MVGHSCYGMGVSVESEMGVEVEDSGRCLVAGYMVSVQVGYIVTRAVEWDAHNWNWEHCVRLWVYPVDMKYEGHLPEES